MCFIEKYRRQVRVSGIVEKVSDTEADEYYESDLTKIRLALGPHLSQRY